MRTSAKIFDQVIILGAGRGTRMGEMGLKTPKPLLPSISDCLLKRQIRYFSNFTDSISVTVGYRADDVGKAALNFGADRIIDVGVDQGNAVFLQHETIRSIGGNFIVVTCDNLMKFSVSDLNILVEEASQTNVIVAIPDAIGKLGDRLQVAPGGSDILGISSKYHDGDLATGLQIINSETLAGLPLGITDFHEFWDYQIEKSRLKVSKIRPATWSSIDTPAELETFFTN